MNNAYGTQLHFRAAFELQSESSSKYDWSNLVRAVRDWLIPRVGTNEGLHGKWLFEGGVWQHPNNSKVVVSSKAAGAKEPSSTPKFWAAAYQHPCNDFGNRNWRTDIGITTESEEAYYVHLTTSFWLSPGYIGDEPPAPIPSSPAIVRSLMNLHGLKAFAGSEQLTLHPNTLQVGHADEFFPRLVDKTRQCPIVYISRETVTGEFLINPSHIARLLAGMAVVYAAESTDCDEELKLFLPQDFRCANGMIRIYQPGVNIDLPSDFRRHRFLSRNYVNENGVEHSKSLIVRGIARRPVFLPKEAVTNLDDITARARELRISSLRSKAVTLSEKESLLGVFEEENRELETKRQELLSQISTLELEVEDRKDKIAWLEHVKQEAEGKSRNLDSRNQELAEAFSKLRTYPTTLRAVVSLIEGIHGDRIAFTPKAKQSVESADFDALDLAWYCLWSMATVLHDIYFSSNKEVNEIDRLFKEKTGFELAFTEGSQTKKDAKLMRLRTDYWRGAEIDISAHVKVDKARKFLRIHYHVAKEDNKIVIGWCGDHLDTAGTRHRK